MRVNRRTQETGLVTKDLIKEYIDITEPSILKDERFSDRLIIYRFNHKSSIEKLLIEIEVAYNSTSKNVTECRTEIVVGTLID